jgi:hypothetical protein
MKGLLAVGGGVMWVGMVYAFEMVGIAEVMLGTLPSLLSLESEAVIWTADFEVEEEMSGRLLLSVAGAVVLALVLADVAVLSPVVVAALIAVVRTASTRQKKRRDLETTLMAARSERLDGSSE